MDTPKGLALIAAFIAILATFAVWVGIWETLGVQQSSLLGRTSTTHA